MNRKSLSDQRREQRDRQKAYRDEQRALKKPSRDDVARAWLWKSLNAAAWAKTKGSGSLDRIENAIIQTLVKQGFDARQSEIAFLDILDRYGKGSSPPFRVKRHLETQDGDLA